MNPQDEINRDAHDAYEEHAKQFRQRRHEWTRHARWRVGYVKWFAGPATVLFLALLALAVATGNATGATVSGVLALFQAMGAYYLTLAHKIEAAQFRVVLELKYGATAEDWEELRQLDPERSWHGQMPMQGRDLLIGLLLVPCAIVAVTVPVAHALELPIPTAVIGALAGGAVVGMLGRRWSRAARRGRERP